MKYLRIMYKWFKPQFYLAFGAAFGVFLSLLILPYINDRIRPEPVPVAVSKPAPVIKPVEKEIAQVDTQEPIVIDQINLRKKFENYKILGFMTSKQKGDVFIIGDDTGATFTDSQITSMGYLVTSSDECTLQITDPRNMANRAYILATNCIPRINEELANI